MDQRIELCIHNQRGFCKFGVKCTKKHEDKVCENRNECTNTECRYRHPRLCKYFFRFRQCKYGEGCAYSHLLENKSKKIEELEKEVDELKEEMKQLKIDLSLKMVSEVKEIKDEMRLQKLWLKRMHDKVETLTVRPKDVESNARFEDSKEEAVQSKKKIAECKETNPESKNDEAKSRGNEHKKEDQKFKCEICSYESKKKITLKKHMNTKHGKVKDKEIDACGTCENCGSCEDCDFMNNGDKCDKCKVLMFKWAAEQCGEAWVEDSE